ncbi:DUF3572 domain-containing protein [uncultured Roseovarius sp.]|uniref:DUF3572 domain-containing protein n=1 Tax=uncultured Roseovarius sp. TaxID=293344 RepID=UPI002605BD50|nr:DUF3572 domain-containing protein [uncultured Roseovarius sp.]
MSHAREFAETLALQCFTWLAGNEELLPIFMGASGVSEEDMRKGAQDPVFLGSVLDFVMMDDAWVIEFCATQGIANDSLMRARMALPGGEHVNWT